MIVHNSYTILHNSKLKKKDIFKRKLWFLGGDCFVWQILRRFRIINHINGKERRENNGICLLTSKHMTVYFLIDNDSPYNLSAHILTYSHTHISTT